MPNNPIEQELQELKDNYRATLPEKLAEIQLLFLELQQQPTDKQLIEKLTLVVHRLRGTAATYGFLQVGDRAFELEQALVEAPKKQNYPRESLHEQLDKLKASIDIAYMAHFEFRSANTVSSKGYLLVVDDDQDFLTITSKMLTHQGFQVTTTTNPENVLEIISNNGLELLLIDVEMPKLSGYQLCKAIKNDAKGRKLPIIFITAHNNLENRIKAFKAGADDFINKPLVIEELMARVTVRLANARLLLEKQEVLNRLQSQHQSLLSILDQLQVGTIMVDAEGIIIFMSASCGSLGGLAPDNAVGKFWQHALPFNNESLQDIQLHLQQHRDELPRMHLHWQLEGKRYWAECEVREVPDRPGYHLLYLYDQSELQRLRKQLELSRFGQMIGSSEPMRQMYNLIEQVARGDWTVLIEGETGVGKELVANSIHATSPRKDGPFIAVNSAGLSESLLSSQLFGHRRGAFTGAVADQPGFFESASGGTLFLDEIGDIPLTMQAVLLRVLQEKEIIRVGESRVRKVDVRIIAASHRDLSNEVKEGRFREDLLYRLRVARIYVPALRSRKGDIPMLAEAFLSGSCRMAGMPIKQINTDTMRLLQSYDWPGNVRELKATLDYAVIHGRTDKLVAEDLPPELLKPAALEAPVVGNAGSLVTEDLPPELLKSAISKSETFSGDKRSRIFAALERAGGNRTQAAKLLGVSRATFYRRLKELDIPPTE
ncbi:MAG: response regulator [Methyloprofundus sp.]|nr:response regulator [Methyloprofundus sp.]